MWLNKIKSLVTILSLSSLALSLAHFDDDWFNTVCQYFVVSELEEQFNTLNTVIGL